MNPTSLKFASRTELGPAVPTALGTPSPTTPPQKAHRAAYLNEHPDHSIHDIRINAVHLNHPTAPPESVASALEAALIFLSEQYKHKENSMI